MKFDLKNKKTIFFFALSLLCSTPVATTLSANLNNKQVIELLEQALHPEDNGYFEDYAQQLEEGGHKNLVSFLHDIKELLEQTPLAQRVSLALKLALKHRIKPFLLRDLSRVLNRYAGKDHLIIAALSRTRGNNQTNDVHVEKDVNYDDAQGHHHAVHATLDIHEEISGKQAAPAA